MAKLSDRQKANIVALYKTGEYSKNSLAKKYKVDEKTIRNITEEVQPTNAEIVEAGVNYENLKKSVKNPNEIKAIEKVVDERTKHVEFFNNSLLKNQSLVNKAHEQMEKDIVENPSLAATYLPSINTASQATARNRESILGKNPDTQVNIQNNNTVNVQPFSSLYTNKDD